MCFRRKTVCFGDLRSASKVPPLSKATLSEHAVPSSSVEFNTPTDELYTFLVVNIVSKMIPFE